MWRERKTKASEPVVWTNAARGHRAPCRVAHPGERAGTNGAVYAKQDGFPCGFRGRIS
ncbi:hypothetical protein BCEN4_780004 [Burkholderia cenocepacia]|nr:hypothetical protein BCEN4_780004 [Burkholderia cenocepacia]